MSQDLAPCDTNDPGCPSCGHLLVCHPCTVDGCGCYFGKAASGAVERADEESVAAFLRAANLPADQIERSELTGEFLNESTARMFDGWALAVSQSNSGEVERAARDALTDLRACAAKFERVWKAGVVHMNCPDWLLHKRVKQRADQLEAALRATPSVAPAEPLRGLADRWEKAALNFEHADTAHAYRVCAADLRRGLRNPRWWSATPGGEEQPCLCCDDVFNCATPAEPAPEVLRSGTFCTRCHQPITDGVMIGDGDGRGQRFAHEHCYREPAEPADEEHT